MATINWSCLALTTGAFFTGGMFGALAIALCAAGSDTDTHLDRDWDAREDWRDGADGLNNGDLHGDLHDGDLYPKNWRDDIDAAANLPDEGDCGCL